MPTEPTATRKLTRSEACAELARRMGVPEHDWPLRPVDLGYHQTGYRLSPPSYFTDYAAARELMEWVCQSDNLELWDNFFDQVYGYNLDDRLKAGTRAIEKYFAAGLFMTAESITTRVCAALGIEVVEEEANATATATLA